MEIRKCNSSIEANFYPLSAAINVKIESNLVEFDKNYDPSEEQVIMYLEQQQSATIKDQMEEAITYMQQARCDPARIGDAFYHKDPVKWQDIENDWYQLFEDIDIEVKVDSRILNTYDFKKPIYG